MSCANNTGVPEKKPLKSCEACMPMDPEHLGRRPRPLQFSTFALAFMTFCFAFAIYISISIGTLPLLFISGTLAFAFCVYAALFYRVKIRGDCRYFWLDDAGQLHMHRRDWWQRFIGRPDILKAQAAKVILEVWLEGWFRNCKVYGEHAPYWTVKLSSAKWNSTQWLIVYDTYKQSHSWRFSFYIGSQYHLNIQNIARALYAIGNCVSWTDAFNKLQNTIQEHPAIAGKVGG